MKGLKFLLEEHIKHRLMGVLVLISIAVIFVPAMLKRSNQQVAEHISVSIKLPTKPELPKVSMVKEKEVFKAVAVNALPIAPLPIVPRMQPVTKAVSLPEKKPEIPVVEAISVRPNVSLTTPTYVVQLASFSQENNAKALVAQLKTKGYSATYRQVGSFFKVFVGQVVKRDDARALQKKLADSVQLQGFIIKDRVSG